MALPEVTRVRYNDSQMTDENSLATALMQYPEMLSPIVTHLGGRESDRFPLTFLTEGSQNTKSIDTHEYEYRVKTRPQKVRPVANSLSGDQGRGGGLFYIPFRDKWFIQDYVLISQSGVQVRIMGAPIPQGGDWAYPVKLTSPDGDAVCPEADVTEGAFWGQLFAPVGVDWSRGNASNWHAPTKISQKIGTIRKSYQMSGNAIETVVQVPLPTEGGGSTNYWMDYEEWQHMLEWKEEGEMFYWYGERSYNDAGITQLVDENGQPIIVPPGLFQQIINKDTYSRLTTTKIKNTLRDLFFGMTDGRQRSIDLYTGTGGLEEFDRAMKETLQGRSASYTVLTQGQFVQGQGSNLSMDGYFKQYKSVDGHTVRVVYLPLFDDGVIAQVSPRHPESGLPLESYRMVFLDTTNYDGQSNVVMINKRGREMLRWAVAGSTIPRGFSGNNLRASDIDGASVHFLKTGHVLLRRFDTSLDLQCVAEADSWAGVQ